MAVPTNEDLRGKVAAITGGSGVLCSEMARALAECGVKVALFARSADKLEVVVSDIKAKGGEAVGIAMDVLDRNSVQAAEAKLFETYGVCDILINGAGGNHPDGTSPKEEVTKDELNESVEGSFFDFKTSGLDFVMGVNYTGTVNTCQVFGERMAKAGKGSIINISSMSAFHPLTKVMAYSNAKAAVNSLTEWLAVHLAPTGVRVNAIAPGFFLTDQNRTLLTNDDGSLTPRADKIARNTPMKRFGEANELTGALLWLANEKASSFVTGTVIAVDGGFNAFSGV